MDKHSLFTGVLCSVELTLPEIEKQNNLGVMINDS